MKKKIILSLIIHVVIITSLFSKVQTTTWYFKQYKISFKIPKTWKVSQKDGVFTAQNSDGTFVELYRIEHNQKSIKSIVMKIAEDYKIKNKKIINTKKIYVLKNRLNQYVLVGSGINPHQKPIYFGIVGVINPKTNYCLIMRLYWFSKTKSTNKNSDLTYMIAKSFRAMK